MRSMPIVLVNIIRLLNHPRLTILVVESLQCIIVLCIMREKSATLLLKLNLKILNRDETRILKTLVVVVIHYSSNLLLL